MFVGAYRLDAQRLQQAYAMTADSLLKHVVGGLSAKQFSSSSSALSRRYVRNPCASVLPDVLPEGGLSTYGKRTVGVRNGNGARQKVSQNPRNSGRQDNCIFLQKVLNANSCCDW